MAKAPPPGAKTARTVSKKEPTGAKGRNAVQKPPSRIDPQPDKVGTMNKRSGQYASTPNLHTQKRPDNTQDPAFNLTLKQQQSVKPSKTMALQEAEQLVKIAQERIAKLKEKEGQGTIDEKLEGALKENKYLQKTMRHMHEVINKLFEKHDPQKAPLKSYPITERHKSPPKSAQMKYRTKEVENAQRALDNMMIEYERVQARMDDVKDPNFLASLHEKLEELKKEIKKIEKENRMLTIQQKKREVDMEKMLAQGAPDAMFKINELQTKVTITKDQLRKEQAELEHVDELLVQVEEQERKLKEKEDKLRAIGKKYNVNFDSADDERKHAEALSL